MSQDKTAEPGRGLAALERVTAALLVLVLLALAWMIAAANWPAWFAWGSTEVEVVAVIGLLTAALVLVSVVALLHTRH